MTPTPRTIGPEALAAEALRLMNARARPITALFVVDAERGAASASCTSMTCCARGWHDRRPAAAAPPRPPQRPAALARLTRARPPIDPRHGAAALDGRGCGSGCCRWWRWRCSPRWRSGPSSTREYRAGAAWPIAAMRSAPQSGEMTQARYHGVDERGRPYTMTATTARQVSPERVNLHRAEGRHHARIRQLADGAGASRVSICSTWATSICRRTWCSIATTAPR